MSFTTPIYGLFLLFVLLFFFIFQLFKLKKQAQFFRISFLAFSYAFYSAWSYFGLLLIIFTSFTDFFVSNLIYYSKSYTKKRLFLVISLIINLGILFLFKYYAFFALIIIKVLSIFNLSADWIPILSLALPVGISFYTFQSLSYTLDVFRGEIQPERKPLHYLLYVSFFPQLVAGPIVPAKTLLPQLDLFSLSDSNLRKGLVLISIGLVKKSLFADRLANLVDAFYLNPSVYSWASTYIAIISYSLQIFCDFSGYTDIARGSALLFGIDLPENFRAPYLSLSLTEFWRRWHITLSNWLKNYLYISLGGNRKGKLVTSVNLLLTMLLGGLWHGASWNFLLWGFLHGLFLVIEKFLFLNYFSVTAVVSTGTKFKKLAFLASFLRWLFVFSLVTLLWVPFRSPNFEITLTILKKIFIYSSGINFPSSTVNEFFLLFFIVILAHIVYLRGFILELYVVKFSTWIVISTFAILLHIVILLSRDSKPFIYFVF